MNEIGVWLDYSGAKFISKTDGITEAIESSIVTRDRVDGEGKEGGQFGAGNYSNNEHRNNNRRSDEESAYLKSLIEKLKPFDHILLFGPSNAKVQLHNFIKENKAFDNKTVVVKPSDKMTENQLAAFVRDYFKEN